MWAFSEGSLGYIMLKLSVSYISQLSWRHPGIFDWWISHQTGMKSPSEYHNQPGWKFKDFLNI